MIPLIFAFSIIIFPAFVGHVVHRLQADGTVAHCIGEPVPVDLRPAAQLGYWAIVFFIMVMGFTFFYTMVSLPAAELAKNLQRQGGFMPGIRPGRAN